MHRIDYEPRTTFLNGIAIQPHSAGFKGRAEQTLQALCLSVLREMMLRHISFVNTVFHAFQPLSFPPTYARLMPKIHAVKPKDFPFSSGKLMRFLLSDAEFVTLSGNLACFSKKAFLAAYTWKVGEHKIPVFDDFCLIDSRSLHPGKKRSFLAPAIVVEMVRGNFDHEDFPFLERYEEAYERLLMFFCSLHGERLIDLIARYGSMELEKLFPEASALISNLIFRISDRREQTFQQKMARFIDQWLKDGSFFSVLEKINLLANSNHIAAIRPFPGVFLRRGHLSNGLQKWKICIRKSPEVLLHLKGIAIEQLVVCCPIDDEHLYAVASKSLKSMWLYRGAKLTPRALKAFRMLPIRQLVISSENPDSILDYLPLKVRILSLFDVSGWGLQKLQGLCIKRLTLRASVLRDQDVKLFAGMPLKKIHLCEIDNISPHAFKSMASIGLERIFLEKMKNSDALLWLQGSFLRKIMLSETHVSNAAMYAIAALPRLEMLKLRNCTLNCELLDLLVDAKVLTRLFLENISVAEGQIERLYKAGIDVAGTYTVLEIPRTASLWARAEPEVPLSTVDSGRANVLFHPIRWVRSFNDEEK